MSRCRDVQKLLDAWALRLLNAEECQRVESHLPQCEACSRIAGESSQLCQFLEELPEKVPVPEGFLESVLRRAEVSEVRKSPIGRSVWRPFLTFAAGALVAASLTWGVHARESQRLPLATGARDPLSRSLEKASFGETADLTEAHRALARERARAQALEGTVAGLGLKVAERDQALLRLSRVLTLLGSRGGEADPPREAAPGGEEKRDPGPPAIRLPVPAPAPKGLEEQLRKAREEITRLEEARQAADWEAAHYKRRLEAVFTPARTARPPPGRGLDGSADALTLLLSAMRSQ